MIVRKKIIYPLYQEPKPAEPPVKPEKDIPAKPDPNPDPTKKNEPEKNDPTRSPDPKIPKPAGMD